MSTKKDNKEVVLKESHAVSNEFAGMFDQSLQSSGDTMDAEDIRLPKLTLIQAMTKQSFNTENAPVGSFINSIEKQDMGLELDMFIMNDVKLLQWDYEVKNGKQVKKEYLTITDYDLCPNIRKEFTPNAVPAEVKAAMERKGVTFEQLLPPDLIFRFHVLLVDEVLEGVAFPYIVDFKRSAAGEGNKLKNIFFKMKKISKLPSYAKVFKLKSEFIQDEFDYYTKKVSGGRKITAEELVAVEGWVRELQNNEAKYSVDESDAVTEDDIVEATVVNENGPKY